MKNSWIKYDTVQSTNTSVSELIKQRTLEEGTVVIADYQETGRGQGQHSWVSQRGENLLMSLLLFPAFLSASEQFYLSMVASLGLCDALEEVGVDPVIKWPNDILIERGKIAGILIEHGIISGHIAHTIIGIGLNVNQTEFPPFPTPATSLYQETGKLTSVADMGKIVESCLLGRYRELREGERKVLGKEYYGKLFMAGVTALFREGDELFEGIIRGVSDSGELMIDIRGNLRTFGYGAISMEVNYGNI
jgi:BirA family biotin operon repressor/biotin-[acetyl-CoA-carboxylase] ligase